MAPKRPYYGVIAIPSYNSSPQVKSDYRTPPVLKTNSFCGFSNQYSSENQLFGILELLLKHIGRPDRLSTFPSQKLQYDQKYIANCPAQF
jgi:hypothetical protein